MANMICGVCDGDYKACIHGQLARARVLLAQVHGTFFGRHAKGVCEICDFLEGKAP